MGDNTEREISTGFTLASVWNKEDDCEWKNLGGRDKIFQFILYVCHVDVSADGIVQW